MCLILQTCVGSRVCVCPHCSTVWTNTHSCQFFLWCFVGISRSLITHTHTERSRSTCWLLCRLGYLAWKINPKCEKCDPVSVIRRFDMRAAASAGSDFWFSAQRKTDFNKHKHTQEHQINMKVGVCHFLNLPLHVFVDRQPQPPTPPPCLLLINSSVWLFRSLTPFGS